jgi:Transmembrane secretion effector
VERGTSLELVLRPGRPGVHWEVFIASSWAEHLWTANRRTQSDAAIVGRLAALYHGPDKPQLTASLGYDFSRHRRSRQRLPNP